MSVLLRAEHAVKTYGPLTALSDVSLTLDEERPSITAVVGESGSGKTTLARILLGLKCRRRDGCCITAPTCAR